MIKNNYLPGLNSLRFIAATLVIIQHAQGHLKDIGINWHQGAPVLHQAGGAVRFFFVLSGFLLTMIAIHELKKQGSINLKFFYLRRCLRIFPLYYLVIIGMIVINAVINPVILHKNTLGQPVLEGTLLNVFMLPNLAKIIWPATVGGLGLLWSIGVEEQFYLFFPHVMNFLNSVKYKLLILILLFTMLSVFFTLVNAHVIRFDSEILRRFIDTLRFDYMLMGSILAYIVFGTKKLSHVLLSVLNHKVVQAVVFILAIGNIFFYNMPYRYWGGAVEPLFFAIIIVSVSCTRNKLINLEIRPFSHWGAISYGMYLLHPFASYALRFAFLKIEVVKQLFGAMPDMYVLLLLVLTIGLAHISYVYYESRFLKLKHRADI